MKIQKQIEVIKLTVGDQEMKISPVRGDICFTFGNQHIFIYFKDFYKFTNLALEVAKYLGSEGYIGVGNAKEE